MTANATALIRAQGVDAMLKTFQECCPQRTQKIIGREPLTVEDLLEIQPPTLEQVSLSSATFSGIVEDLAVKPSAKMKKQQHCIDLSK